MARIGDRTPQLAFASISPAIAPKFTEINISAVEPYSPAAGNSSQRYRLPASDSRGLVFACW